MNDLERPATKAYNIASPAWYEFQLRIALRTAEGIDALSTAINKARSEFGVLFIGKEAEFEALLAELSKREYKNDDELIKTFAKSIGEFVQSNFSLADLEQRARAPERLRKDQIRLNEMLFFNLGKDDPTQIRLHIQPASTLPIGEKLKQFRGGLQELARVLEEDSRFAQVQSIMVRSWIVLKNPEIFERLGFKILEEDEKDHIWEARQASISREDFNKKYGK